MGNEGTGNKRNYGIDALRILSMFMIVVLHILGQGGILGNVKVGTTQYAVAWFLESMAYCAVNCYALISGYVGIKTKFRYSRILVLWLQVIFYTILITLAFAVVLPGSVTAGVWKNTFFPIITNQYWYLTAYFGMFILIPLMNTAINNLGKRELYIMGMGFVLCFSLLPCIFHVDPFCLYNGYSMLWLCILYIIGAILSKYRIDQKIGGKTAGLMYVVAVILTWLSKCVVQVYFSGSQYEAMFLNYTSPTMLMASIALLFLFIKLDKRIKGKRVMKAISLLAASTLGVYILHSHPLVWEYCMQGVSAGFVNDHSIILLLKVLGAALGVYLVCSVIDIARNKIFSVLKVAKRCENICSGVNKN